MSDGTNSRADSRFVIYSYDENGQECAVSINAASVSAENKEWEDALRRGEKFRKPSSEPGSVKKAKGRTYFYQGKGASGAHGSEVELRNDPLGRLKT